MIFQPLEPAFFTDPFQVVIMNIGNILAEVVRLCPIIILRTSKFNDIELQII